MKLEVGQRVRLKNGEEHDVTVNDDTYEKSAYPFAVAGFGYTADGRFHSDGAPSNYDVAKILTPTPKPSPTGFEVGKWYPCRNHGYEVKILGIGLQGSESPFDILLPEPPEPKVYTLAYWSTVYLDRDGEPYVGSDYPTHEDALEGKNSDCIAIKRNEFTVTKGEGL